MQSGLGHLTYQDRATIREYEKAIHNEQVDLARRIRYANKDLSFLSFAQVRKGLSGLDASE